MKDLQTTNAQSCTEWRVVPTISDLIPVPKTKCTTLKDKPFAYIGPSPWNTLPLANRSIRAVQGFKQALQTFVN